MPHQHHKRRMWPNLFRNVFFSFSVHRQRDNTLYFIDFQMEVRYWGQCPPSPRDDYCETGGIKNLIWNAVQSCTGADRPVALRCNQHSLQGDWSLPGARIGLCPCTWWGASPLMSSLNLHLQNHGCRTEKTAPPESGLLSLRMRPGILKLHPNHTPSPGWPTHWTAHPHPVLPSLLPRATPGLAEFGWHKGDSPPVQVDFGSPSLCMEMGWTCAYFAYCVHSMTLACKLDWEATAFALIQDRELVEKYKEVLAQKKAW